ncbi:hypothetical protein OG810_15430 [Streptomyces sp. NBC_01693]|uniref:Secreted protein n=1 Tax=Streptomyces sp. gb1(2016) TaxID=1828321 RepID=A0A652KIY8_9ACTN|nr:MULTISPECIES: hypothetical protein [unclassified Streptomyces]TXS23566.1 hypothetical protein EAO74_23570 [Streptomyces sp. gb1(2016)]WSS63440.1 hypothetical protein OG284_20515 [Streptomyces sp. NBC_01177]WSS70435.1 hypothetical protein OG491_20135 [Streptomyces sp. NBC_01175]
MRKTLIKAAVVGASVLALSGITAGAAQASVQGPDITGTGSFDDCMNWGRALKNAGEVEDFACMVGSKPNTFELTPFYAS